MNRNTGCIHSGMNQIKARKCFTLIEVLLAMTLTTVVMTLTGKIAVQTIQARNRVNDILTDHHREALVVDLIERDIRNMLPVLPDDQTSVQLFGAPQQVLQLSVMAAIHDDDASLHLIKQPATIRYRLIRNISGDHRFDLIRETIDRTDAGALPVKETIAANVKEFSVHILSKNKWLKSYPQRDRHLDPPRAVRILLSWNDGNNKSVVRTWEMTDAN